MKKMRKMVSLALTAAMTAGLMTGMGALTASADSERTKITALRIHRYPVLEPGTYPGDQGSCITSVISNGFRVFCKMCVFDYQAQEEKRNQL